jgi:hypothetical protein
MSQATIFLDSFCEQLAAFLTEYDQRIGRTQAVGLVRKHKCRLCGRSFFDLLRNSQFPIFLRYSHGAIHDLCPECALIGRGKDAEARVIDLSSLEGESDEVRKVIFDIMAGELRFSRHGSVKGSVQGPKPGCVRRHPAGRGSVVR